MKKTIRETVRNMLNDVTTEDLRQWAGDKIYNRGKDYTANVSQLSCTEDGRLVARVSGTDDYATWTRHAGNATFEYGCTCPYDGWGPCKHVVAVLLAAADRLKKKKAIPLLDPNDDLYLEAFEDEDDWTEEGDGTDIDGSSVGSPKSFPQIEAMLAGKSRDELQGLLVDLAHELPEVSRRLQDMSRLAGGQFDKIVRSLRREIRRLTSEEAWYNHWNGEGNLPDYSHVKEQLEALLARGQADAVFELGGELWKRGASQVEESHDEGETADAIASCLAVVLRALPQTSLTPPEQLLWWVEHELDDEYNLLDAVDDVLIDAHYTEAHWQEVALALADRLARLAVPKSGAFSETYKREKVMTWLCHAYSRSGEAEKIIPLLEQEADRCRSYDRLVKALLETGENEKARQWCIHGFKKTIGDAPGIAGKLQMRLQELAQAEGRFALAAAYRAEDFFTRPSEQTYGDVRIAAERIQAWPAVREGILAYLQSGARPVSGGKGKTVWPLPETEVKVFDSQNTFRRASFPNREMLIEIAILEKRYDDAVSIYQDLAGTRRWNHTIDERLAGVVATSHPNVALKIWLSIAEDLIGEVKPRAYQEAAGYLRRMHKVFERTGRNADWKSLLQRIRLEHKAKRRLMEVLDGLENNRKLVE